MILIADDDNAIRLSLSMLLRKASYEVKAVATPAEVIDTVRSTAPRLVMLDMNFSRATSGDEGLTLLRQVKVFRPETPVILITAWGSIPLAVEGVRAGAFDFITKPWDNAALLQRVATALELSGGKREGEGDFDRSRIIGESPALLHVLDTVRRVAATDAPLLIMGENGTGKELIAETLHANSRRRGAPFVKVNMGGISRSLFESEMFGHRKGAFTGATADREGRFAVADKGTIFLDEIGELDANSQVKLLRVLQEHSFEMLGDSRTRHVDIRVVCATNADLPAMVADGRFREDLFYRINLITVTLPPLRERPGDIPALARHFAAGFCRANGMEMPEIAPDAMASLRGLPYPGNIRELKNLVERTILISGKSILHAADVEAAAALTPAAVSAATAATHGLEGMERAAVEDALRRSAGNLSQAAAMLGITRQSLYRRMEKYHIR
ncbi:MAG: sigma-54 dependent transcriptional regulator [Muribaculaceae bacterium]|nr:sigma-54 dependent transcriptional regulator [Muribaculaceae bacterium]